MDICRPGEHSVQVEEPGSAVGRVHGSVALRWGAHLSSPQPRQRLSRATPDLPVAGRWASAEPAARPQVGRSSIAVAFIRSRWSKPASGDDVPTYANETMTGLRHAGLREVTPSGRPVDLAGQASEQDTPPSLRATAVPGQPVEGVVHLKCHDSTIHFAEQPFADLDHHFGIVDGVVDGQNQGGAVRVNPQMSVVVSLGSEREEPPTFREIQHLRTALVDPHASIFGPPTLPGQGRRSPRRAPAGPAGLPELCRPLTSLRSHRAGCGTAPRQERSGRTDGRCQGRTGLQKGFRPWLDDSDGCQCGRVPKCRPDLEASVEDRRLA